MQFSIKTFISIQDEDTEGKLYIEKVQSSIFSIYDVKNEGEISREVLKIYMRTISQHPKWLKFDRIRETLSFVYFSPQFHLKWRNIGKEVVCMRY